MARRSLTAALLLFALAFSAWAQAERTPLHVVTEAGDFLIILDPNLDAAATHLVADRVRAGFYRGGQVKRVAGPHREEYHLSPARPSGRAAQLLPAARRATIEPGRLLLLDDQLVIVISPDPRWARNPRVRVLGYVEGPHVVDALKAGQSTKIRRVEFLAI